ncbi:MAG TPA: type I DNA topoisomerase [Phycisphaerae bacterium]|nr:type I DNA topoisomerase [Phycisphaerae bacterium]
MTVSGHPNESDPPAAKARSPMDGCSRPGDGPKDRSAPTGGRQKTDQDAALVIVESPAKARTIAKYLGPGFIVESSIGHIRDLPSTASEIPAQYKEQEWARIGVNVDERFKPLYIIPSKKKSQVTKLKQLLKKADRLYLATDEDREGEAIAWHLTEVLQPDVPVHRMIFDEITKQAIQEALANPRQLDMQLVNAQEARRILDRLYGYEISPVLWRKIGPKLSAGRVQSVATRLIVERERERMRFVSAGYWDIEAELLVNGDRPRVLARLIELGDRRIATGKDFDPATGQLTRPEAVVLDEKNADAAARHLRRATFSVSQVTEKPFTQRAYAPFITSTLQQEAARKLRFGVARTMRIAQSLYENGYITYMRTDSTNLSTQALNAARGRIRDQFGAEYLPDHPRVYQTKAKGAQEAHEAIRPAGSSFRTPQELEGELEPDAWKLYDLIYKRTLACQMKDAVGRRTSVRINAPAGEFGQATFTASGRVFTFDGFLRAYAEEKGDGESEVEDQDRTLPPLIEGQPLAAGRIDPRAHMTVPPARYTEASLIKELEERGIGRPSTYATIIQTIQDRGYAWKNGTALVPTFTAFAVTQLLEKHFGELVDFDFTAKMEDDLDAIATGKLESEPWLRVFYFGDPKAHDGFGDFGKAGLKGRIGAGWDKIDARQISTIPLGKDDRGQMIVARIGRYGPYVQADDTDKRVTIPNDLPPDELSVSMASKLLEQAALGDKAIGDDPATGKPIYLKNGRFGNYVQLGDPEVTEKGTLKRGGKPKMASLWPTMTPETLTLKDALMLLSFPRTVGEHPETHQPITVQDGKYGPYLKTGENTRSLENHEQLGTLTVEQALKLLAQPKRGRGRVDRQPPREAGRHPQSGAKLQVKAGRFGPYVTDGVVHASLPRGMDPNALTLDKAVELLAAREQKLRDQGKDPRAPKPKRRSRKRKSE